MDKLDEGQRAALLETTRLFFANFHELMKEKGQ
jgi:hypothetical protein